MSELASTVPSRFGRRRTGWPHDLVLGVRLAVGGGRTSWTRLALGTLGIGMATVVLFVAASVGNAMTAWNTREDNRMFNSNPIAGVAPLTYYSGSTEFRGANIAGYYLRATGPNSPVPPGVATLPKPGEVVLSPALADLLDSSDGALLRPRFPEQVIGTIGRDGLRGPNDLLFYAGTTPPPDRVFAQAAYSFGAHTNDTQLTQSMLALLLVGVVALLVPILIMVGISSRIAGAQRDRRLAALRLVGAGSRQVRRIAAAESLASAVTGLVLGVGVFLVLRQVLAGANLGGASFYADDITPAWPLAALSVLAVPLLAVGTALIALRRTIIEPLGVVRGSRSVRRRVWWRAGLIVLGVGLLLLAKEQRGHGNDWAVMLSAGAAALLIGVPVMLPWLLERSVAAIRGGAPSWQLAMRRLQLDSGTPARVVGGVAVVLAGAIALETLLAATSTDVGMPSSYYAASDPYRYEIGADPSVGAKVAAAVAASPAVKDSYQTTNYVAMRAGSGSTNDRYTDVDVVTCQGMAAMFGVTGCVDGDVYLASASWTHVTGGSQLTMTQEVSRQHGNPDYVPFGQWTVPANAKHLTGKRPELAPFGEVLATPGALAGVRLPPANNMSIWVNVRPDQPDAEEYLRNATGPYPLLTFVDSPPTGPSLGRTQLLFVQVRNGLLVGSMFTLLLAGISLLVLALEQVRERRRPLAILAAAGVPKSVLARSLMWQTAVPVLIGVLAAVVTGVGLAELVLLVARTPLMIDWTAIGVFSAAAVVLTLLVTAATLPALRGATRLSSLRTE